MNIIKQKLNYILIDARGTHYEGSYQILEINDSYPKGETCAIYLNKKDALNAFKTLTH